MSNVKFVTILILFMALLGCAKESPKVAAQFNAVQIGEARDVLISRIGVEPDREYSNILGLSYETLSWSARGTTYYVTLVNDHVISKKISQNKEGDKKN